MEEKRWYNSFYVAIALAVLLVIGAISVSITVADDEESIEVECYLKVDDDYVSVSNVDVFDASKAALTCNALYLDCKGECIGCYIDENDAEYCYDNAGRKFQR